MPSDFSRLLPGIDPVIERYFEELGNRICEGRDMPPGSEYVPLFGFDLGSQDETVVTEMTVTSATYAATQADPEAKPTLNLETLRRTVAELNDNMEMSLLREAREILTNGIGCSRPMTFGLRRPFVSAAASMRHSRSRGKVIPFTLKDDRDDSMMTLDGLKSCHGLDLIKEADAMLAKCGTKTL